MAENKDQQVIIYRIKCGVSLSAVIIISLWFFAPFPYPEQAETAERLAFAIRWLLVVPLAMGYPIQKVGNTRFETA